MILVSFLLLKHLCLAKPDLLLQIALQLLHFKMVLSPAVIDIDFESRERDKGAASEGTGISVVLSLFTFFLVLRACFGRLVVFWGASWDSTRVMFEEFELLFWVATAGNNILSFTKSLLWKRRLSSTLWVSSSLELSSISLSLENDKSSSVMFNPRSLAGISEIFGSVLETDAL